MSTLYVMCGIPGSGKSTFTGKLKEKGVVVISTDEIRKELTGSEEDQSANKKVFKLAYARTEKALQSGKNVCFDATNTSVRARAGVLKCAGEDVRKVCICMKTDKETCMYRNENRARKVPTEVIMRMIKGYEEPTKKEGFNAIEFC